VDPAATATVERQSILKVIHLANWEASQEFHRALSVRA